MQWFLFFSTLIYTPSIRDDEKKLICYSPLLGKEKVKFLERLVRYFEMDLFSPMPLFCNWIPNNYGIIYGIEILNHVKKNWILFKFKSSPLLYNYL